MKKFARALCVMVSLVMCVACFSFTACKKGSNETLVLSVQELDNVFNPYFSTSGYDSEILGNTQISMLGSDRDGEIYCGTDEPSVALDYNQWITYNGEKFNANDPDPNKRAPNLNGQTPSTIDEEKYYTTYQLLLKNNIKFSDGTDLTPRDVIFNMYCYLDPAYSGSATMYSTDIYGLKEYRLQKQGVQNDSSDSLDTVVQQPAIARLNRLQRAYYPGNTATRDRYRASYETSGFKQQILEDAELARFYFYKEVMADWKSAEAELESYEEENRKTDEKTVNSRLDFTETWEIFLYNYGFISVERNSNGSIKTYNAGDQKGYRKDGTQHVAGEKKIDYKATGTWYHDKDNLTKIVFNNYMGIGETGSAIASENNPPKCDVYFGANGVADTSEQTVNSSLKEKATNVQTEYWDLLYNSSNLIRNLSTIVTFYGTANTLFDEFVAEATEEALGSKVVVDHIKGIKLLQYNAGDEFVGVNGTHKLDDTYYVLEVRVDRVDPKALANFGFIVAPMAYYSNADNLSTSDNDYNDFKAHDYRSFNYPVCDKNGNQLNEVVKAADGSRIWDPAVEVSVGRKINSKTYFDKVLKNSKIISVPVGAGMYQVSSRQEEDPYYLFEKNGNEPKLVNGQPVLRSDAADKRHSFSEFDSDNFVYFIYNPFFFTTSGKVGRNANHITARDDVKNDITNCKIKNVFYMIITATKLLDSITKGEVHYGDPTSNTQNLATIQSNKNLSKLEPKNNGYGYIGINAKYVPDLNVRRAIMYAMDRQSIKTYYGNSASIIERPISECSWASPANNGEIMTKIKDDIDNFDSTYNKAYYPYTSDREALKQTINNLVDAAGYDHSTPRKRKLPNGVDHELKYTFTIAGATDDHPAYKTMQEASQLLNECGFDTTVKTDSMALSRLANGELTVWAAAWSSGSDPDMYQIYHEESRATSVQNWGYPTILANKSEEPYKSQYTIISDLSKLIDEGRSTLDKEARAKTYLKALNKIMELAVELPTYQRTNLYVYRNDIIDSDTLNNDPTPFYGPLARMWEVELK